MDIRSATLIREVSENEPWDEVINEAKALTWTHRCEIALLGVATGQLMLVRGGVDGIEFQVTDNAVWVEIDQTRNVVKLLAWHTHPRPTGPSDHDRQFCECSDRNRR